MKHIELTVIFKLRFKELKLSKVKPIAIKICMEEKIKVKFDEKL